MNLMIEASSAKPGGGLWSHRLSINEGDCGLGDVFVRGAGVEHDVLVCVGVHLVVPGEVGRDVGHDDGDEAPGPVGGRGVVVRHSQVDLSESSLAVANSTGVTWISRLR